MTESKDLSSLLDALDMALELIDLRRNGTSLGEEFPESRARIAAAASARRIYNPGKRRCEARHPHLDGGTVGCEQEADHLGPHTNHSYEWPQAARTGPLIEHLVSEYDSQREGMVIVSGWRIQAQVTGVTGRKFAPVTVAVCPNKDDAEEILELLAAKYGGADRG